MDLLTFLLFVAVVVLGGLLFRAQVAATTVFEYERALRFTRGRFRGVIQPGLYRYLRAYTTIVKVDLRPSQIAVNSQEVLTRDGVAVKASVTGTYAVRDPEQAIVGVASYMQALHVELQQALRAAVAAVDAETLVANRASLGAQILEACAAPVMRCGLDLQGVAIRDFTFPGELKKIFAQVVKARQEGLAALERARGETAALRSLANAAQLVQRNPQLMQLRLLQVVGERGGNTLVVGMPPGTSPLPVRGDADIRELAEPMPPDEGASE